VNIGALAFTSVLLLAAILATILVDRARSGARDYIRFAASLYGALSLAGMIDVVAMSASVHGLANAVSLIVLSLAPVALTLALASAFEGAPPPATSIVSLLLGCICGMLAAATGAAFVAIAVLFASVCVILTFAIRHWRKDRSSSLQALIAGATLLASAAAGSTAGIEAETSRALFSAAAILGAALACGKRLERTVQQEPAITSNVIPLIRRER
jgi:hypothetical protein